MDSSGVADFQEQQDGVGTGTLGETPSAARGKFLADLSEVVAAEGACHAGAVGGGGGGVEGWGGGSGGMQGEWSKEEQQQGEVEAARVTAGPVTAAAAAAALS